MILGGASQSQKAVTSIAVTAPVRTVKAKCVHSIRSPALFRLLAACFTSAAALFHAFAEFSFCCLNVSTCSRLLRSISASVCRVSSVSAAIACAKGSSVSANSSTLCRSACRSISIWFAKRSTRLSFETAADCRKISVLLITHSTFCQPCGAISLTQIATFHGHAIKPVREAGELCAFELDNWYKLHADALQMLLILGEAATVLGCGITKVLQFLAGGGLACTQGAFDLALGRRAPLSLDARRNTDKVVIPLDLAHQDFLTSIVLAVADDFPIKPDTVRQNVDVFMLGIGVPDH